MKAFKLSQAYEQFWDRLEHANFSLEMAIALRKEPLDSRKNQLLLQNLIGDGGDWSFVTSLIDKYGVVPQDVMPNTYSASHTHTMDNLLATRIRQAILKIREAGAKGASMDQMRAIKTDALKDVYKIAVLCLGQPPQTFKWRYETKDGKVTPYKTYTPKSFYSEFVGVNLKDYVALVNYPGQPMHANLEWAWYRGMEDHPNVSAINVTSDELADMCKNSVMGDDAVWFASNAGAPGDVKAGLWSDSVARLLGHLRHGLQHGQEGHAPDLRGRARPRHGLHGRRHPGRQARQVEGRELLGRQARQEGLVHHHERMVQPPRLRGHHQQEIRARRSR